MSYADTERGIQAWVVRGSGLAGHHVIWANPESVDGQMSTRPKGQHIELQLMGIVTMGRDGYVSEDNPNASTGNAAQDAAILRTVGTRMITLTVTCYGGTTNGETQPLGILMGVQAAARQESQSAAFADLGIALKQISGVLSLTGRVIDGVRIEPAATFTVQFWASPGAVPGPTTETCSTIEHVIVHGDIDGGTRTIDFQVDKPTIP